MNKILSIIIPSCNMEKYLGQCLDSLLVPSINDIEILVINDGSKDRTSEIAHEYEGRYPQSIRVIDKPNGHYGSCVNRGLQEATGKYVKILDADDSFDSNVFEKFIGFLKKTDVDLVLSNYSIVDETGALTENRNMAGSSTEQKVFAFNDIPEILSSKFMAMHGVCYRRQMLIGMGYKQTEGVAYTDQEWIFEPMTKVRTIALFPLSVYRYLVGREGQSISKDVIMRNMGIQLTLIAKRVSLLGRVRKTLSDAHYDYLTWRLKYSLTNTYRTLLLRKEANNLVPKLMEIDDSIRNVSPELYQDLGNMTIKSWLPIRFVKRWRKTVHKQ